MSTENDLRQSEGTKFGDTQFSSNITATQSQNPLNEPLIEKESELTRKKKPGILSRKERRLKGRVSKLSQGSHPLDKTGTIGALFYSWVNPFLWIGNRTSFLQDMHPAVPKRDSVENNESRLFEVYKKKGSIGSSIASLFFWNLVKNFILMGVAQFSFCMMSVCMYFIIMTNQDQGYSRDEKNELYLYLFGGLLGSQVVGSFLFNYITCDLSRLSVRLKSGVIFAIYKKLLRISVLNPSEHTEGNILNYINVDAQKLEDAITKLNLLFESFWLIVFGFTICVYLVSFNIVACVIVFFSLTFLSMGLYKLIFKYEVRFMIAKDKRTQLLKNVINNVKYIKTRVWENFYHSKIYLSRNTELKAMSMSNIVFVMIVTLAWINPTVSYLSTFISMLYFDYHFQTAKVLAYMRIFTSILRGMGNIPNVVQFFIELHVSLKRLNTYFDCEEINYSYLEKAEDTDQNPFAIEIELGNFYWNKMDEGLMKKRRERSRKRKLKIRKYKKVNFQDDANLIMDNQSIRNVSVMKSTLSTMTGYTNASKISAAPTLRGSLLSEEGADKIGFQIMDIEMLIPKGELVMIFGEIGSGKSSIFYSILNEMNAKYADPLPKLKTVGDILFVSQNPWLLNMSIIDNVILDLPYDEDRFQKALKLSALDSDIDMFEEGAERVLTDGASNLSGGQRTRVALARAFYQQPDIYLFDDPLSALDSIVGEYIMENSIAGELKGKTRLIITHALHFLKYADKIFYVEEGKIVFKGSYSMLKKQDFFQQYMKNKDEKEEKEKEEKKKSKKQEKKPEKPKNEVRNLEPSIAQENPLLRLFASEDRSKGRLSCNIIHRFIVNTGGYLFFFVFFALSVSGAFGQYYGAFYILQWSNKFEEEYDRRWKNMLFMVILLIGYCLLASIRYALFLYFGVNLSRNMHAKMVFKVLHAPVEEFLELVPRGRILNRFTKDINTIDKILIKIAALAIFKLIQFFVSFYFMAISLNVGICAVLTVFFMCAVMIQNHSMNTKREVVRLESISKSPIVTWTSQTIKGLPQLRTLHKENWFIENMVQLIETNLKNSILVYGLDSWFQLRITLLNVFLVQLPAYAYILYANWDADFAVDKVSLFLMLATGLSDDIIKVLQSLSELEASMVSIERCEFFNHIPPETGYQTVKQEEKKYLMVPKSIKPTQLCLPPSYNIVEKGHVVFENVTARYGENAEPVLKNLTFEVKPGEKVGIVGRTGAGKSSLIKMFWMSLKPCNGRIIVDGTDIAKVDLKKLRNEVMIVSQESALFLGSLRENIDPTVGKDQDEMLQSALNKLEFKNQNVANKGLDYRVDAGGANFSQGERQVVCFSRTLINKRKLIVLDEATANIDVKTEMAIQRAQNSEFKESTMFIIAHRINTVLECDKIMVLKFGELMEFDSPQNLLQNEDSYFKKIYDKMVEQNEGIKKYASDHALQCHLKINHSAGRKSDREKYAESIFTYLRNNESIKAPEKGINIPENFIHTVTQEHERLKKLDYQEPFVPSHIFNYEKSDN